MDRKRKTADGFEVRTDLALEERESFKGDGGEVSGVALREWERDRSQARFTEVKIINEQGARAMGKPVGTYLTLEADQLSQKDEEYHRRISRELAGELSRLMRDMLEMGNRRRVVCRVHRENQAALAFFQAMGFVPLEGEPPEEPEKLWLAYHLRPWDPAAPKPTKPYLVEAADYEAAREKAAALVDVSGLE